MKYALIFLALTACGQSYVTAEQDHQGQDTYLRSVYEHRQYRPEVYSDDEYVSDCDEYQMEECFK